MKTSHFIQFLLVIVILQSSCKKDDPSISYNFFINSDIIENVLPESGHELSIYDTPSVTFSIEMGKIYTNENNISYRAVLDTFYIVDNAEMPVEGSLRLSGDNKIAYFIPNLVFNVAQIYRMHIITHYEYLDKDNWTVYPTAATGCEYSGTFVSSTQSPLQEDVFLSSEPTDQAEDVSPYSKLTVTCKFPIDSIIPFYYTKIEHRLKFVEFLVQSENSEIQGKVNLLDNKLSFVPYDTLPSGKLINYSLKLYWEIFYNNEWRPFFEEGDTIYSELVGQFITENKTYTSSIDSANIEYSYPVNRQFHLLKDESLNGYLKLKLPQENVLDAQASTLWVRYSSPGLDTIMVNLEYNATDLLFSYPIPSSQLMNTTIYKLEFVQKNELNTEENIFYTMYFRTSKYNTFKDKWASTTYGSFSWPEENGIHLIGFNFMSDEYFDKFENSCLINLSGLIDNKWYQEYIYPVLYKDYATSGLYLNRNIELAGLPPFNLFDRSNLGSEPYFVTDLQIENNSAYEPNISFCQITYHIEKVVYQDFNDLSAQISVIPEEERTEYMKTLANTNYTPLLSGYPNSEQYNIKLRYMITPEICSSEVIVAIDY